MTDNSNKIILDLCGGTGAWSKPYKDAGYDVRLITLPDYDVTATDYAHERLIFRNGATPMAVLYEDVYGILAAPPCTEFSQALNGRRERDVAGALKIVGGCMGIIWQCQLRGKPKFWALENPAALLSPAPLARYLGRPRFSFEQWEFGGDKEKLTYIWGYFREPKPTISAKPPMDKECHAHAPGWTKPKPPDWYAGPKLDRAAIRAITPQGFAQAFYKANK